VDDAVTGARPVFKVGYENIDVGQLRRTRFRIAISEDDFRSEAYVFDQRERRTGWLPGEPGSILFRPPRPLVDGSYEWRVAVWNGLTWEEASATRRLRVDTTPPAVVEELLLERDPSGPLRLDWEPVVTDLEGRPEFVTRYHVYRYVQGPPYPVVRSLRLASTPEHSWTDEEELATPALILYRVTAEDEAGNEALRRD
jgi:hypothetical protein